MDALDALGLHDSVCDFWCHISHKTGVACMTDYRDIIACKAVLLHGLDGSNVVVMDTTGRTKKNKSIRAK